MNKTYYERNKEKIKPVAKAWRKNNKEHLRKYSREYKKAHPLTKEARIAAARRNGTWRERHPEESILANRKSSWKVCYGLLIEDISKMLEDQQNCCVGCGTKIGILSCSPDHVIARVHGGTDVKSNFQLLCDPCNRAKSTMSMADFIRLSHMVAKNNPNGAIGAFSLTFGWRRGKNGTGILKARDRIK